MLEQRTGHAYRKKKMKLVLPLLLFSLVFVIPGLSTLPPGPSAGRGGAGGIYNVMDFGAKGDGKTDDSRAIEAAWKAACAASGCPKLLIPTGSYLTGQIKFTGPCKNTSTITVQLDGTMLAATSLSLYKTPEWVQFGWINNLVLTGKGTFDGQGTSCWAKTKCPSNSCWGKTKLRPISLKFHAVINGTVKGITSLNPKFFHIGIVSCQSITVSGVKIVAPGDSPNTDGIHIERSSGVTITDTQIGTGDDCISIGQGTKDLTVTRVTCGPGHGISVGSLGKYPKEEDVSSLLVKNCTLTKTMFGARIKTWEQSPGPSCATNITFEDIIMNDVGNPVLIDQTYCPFASCAGKAPSKVSLKDITFRNIKGTSSTPEAVIIDCSKDIPCSNVIVENVHLDHIALKPILCTNVQPKFIQTSRPAPCKMSQLHHGSI